MQFKKDIEKLDSVQRTSKRMIKETKAQLRERL